MNMATVEKTLTNEEYHAHRATSHSTLEMFRRSRKLYHAIHVARTMDRPEPTAAMQLGTHVHCAVLEPERFEAEYVYAPKCDRRTTAGKAAYAEFCAATAGKTVIDA